MNEGCVFGRDGGRDIFVIFGRAGEGDGWDEEITS